MTNQRKRLIRSRKKGSRENDNVPQEHTSPIASPLPIQQPIPVQQPEEPKTKRDILFAEDTQTCTISLEDIKSGQIRVYVNGNIEPQIIKLPKPLALALRMAYREGLNSAKQPQIITSKQSREEEYVIKAAEEMTDFLKRLGHCHGKTEQNLLDAVKILKESRNRKPF